MKKMTVATRQLKIKKARSKFSIPDIKKRIKRRFRVKFKESIEGSEIDKIWADYVDSLIDRVSKGERVEVTEGFTFEVVGRKIVEDKSIFNLMLKGLRTTRGGDVLKVDKVYGNRPGFIYKIEMKNKNFKTGELYFSATKKFREKVCEKLNTSQYFRTK